jgi:hypothetical protein
MADAPPRRPKRSCQGGAKDPRDVEKERREAERRTKELEKIAKQQKKARDAQAAARASGQFRTTGEGYWINESAGTIFCTAGKLKGKCWKDTEEHRKAFKASADASKQRKTLRRNRETKAKREATGGTISNPGNFRPIQPSAIVEQPRKRLRVVLGGKRFDPLTKLVVTIGGVPVYDVRLQFVPKAIVALPPTVAAPASVAALCRPVTPPLYVASRWCKKPPSVKQAVKNLLIGAPRASWGQRCEVVPPVNEYSLPLKAYTEYNAKFGNLPSTRRKPTKAIEDMVRVCASLSAARSRLLSLPIPQIDLVPAHPNLFLGGHRAFEPLALLIHREGNELARTTGCTKTRGANIVFQRPDVGLPYLSALYGVVLSPFEFDNVKDMYEVSYLLGERQAAPEALVVWPSPMAALFSDQALLESWNRIAGDQRVAAIRFEISTVAKRAVRREAAGFT